MNVSPFVGTWSVTAGSFKVAAAGLCPAQVVPIPEGTRLVVAQGDTEGTVVIDLQGCKSVLKVTDDHNAEALPNQTCPREIDGVSYALTQVSGTFTLAGSSASLASKGSGKVAGLPVSCAYTSSASLVKTP